MYTSLWLRQLAFNKKPKPAVFPQTFGSIVYPKTVSGMDRVENLLGDYVTLIFQWDPQALGSDKQTAGQSHTVMAEGDSV